MAVVTRTASATKFGVDVTSIKIGSTEMIAQMQDASFSIEQESVDASSVLDNDSIARAGIKSATLELSNVVDSTAALAMITGALGTAEVAVEFTHAVSGVKWSGTGIITSAEVRTSGKDLMTASGTIVSNGVWATTAGAATAATPRNAASQAATQRGVDLASVAIGTDDFINLFNEVGIRVEVQVEEAAAALDGWKVRQAVKRTTTLDLGKVVEAALPWVAMVATGTAVSCNIITALVDADQVDGTFLPTSGGWSGGGAGAQSERITLQSVGAVTFAPPDV